MATPEKPSAAGATKWLALLLGVGASCAPPKSGGLDVRQGPTRTIAAKAPAHAHWGYEGDDGPAHWSALETEWALCNGGKRQSPIDIDHAVPRAMADVTTAFRPAKLKVAHNEHLADVENTGHSVQVSFPGGDQLTIGDDTYELLQFHFHVPSEHTVRGQRFPMEIHLVHRDAQGALAVIGVLVRAGHENPGLAAILRYLPTQKGVEYHYDHVRADGTHVLPADRTTYRYDGSLTTPPCSEGVKWIVFATPIEAAQWQIDALSTAVGKNNRPIQPINAREIETDSLKP
jgi:carbonic anhydrase